MASREPELRPGTDLLSVEERAVLARWADACTRLSNEARRVAEMAVDARTIADAAAATERMMHLSDVMTGALK